MWQHSRRSWEFIWSREVELHSVIHNCSPHSAAVMVTRAVSVRLGPSGSPRWSCWYEQAWWRMPLQSHRCDSPRTTRMMFKIKVTFKTFQTKILHLYNILVVCTVTYQMHIVYTNDTRITLISTGWAGQVIQNNITINCGWMR